MTEKINAFHPLYVQTYMPEFCSALRKESTQYANGVINGGKSKASREAKSGKSVNSINVFPPTKPTKRVSLDRKKSFIINYEKAQS